jgi:hypothetical protein
MWAERNFEEDIEDNLGHEIKSQSCSLDGG